MKPTVMLEATHSLLRTTGNSHKVFTCGSVEWYSPSNIVEDARKVLDGIHLDPASNEIANKVVKADHYYTFEQDGLTQTWFGNIFCNPPGGKIRQKSLQKMFWEKLTASTFNHAIFLAFSIELLQVAQLGVTRNICSTTVCIPSKRLMYTKNGDVATRAASRASAIIYVPGTVNRDFEFINTFKKYGSILKPC